LFENKLHRGISAAVKSTAEDVARVQGRIKVGAIDAAALGPFLK